VPRTSVLRVGVLTWISLLEVVSLPALLFVRVPKLEPHEYGLTLRPSAGQLGLDLKTKLMVWVSLPLMVTSCDCSP
jgi:hypothetical protein